MNEQYQEKQMTERYNGCAEGISVVNSWVVTNYLKNRFRFFNWWQQSRTRKGKSDLENNKSLLQSKLNPFNPINNKNILFNIKTEIVTCLMLCQLARKGKCFLYMDAQTKPEKCVAFKETASIYNFKSESLFKKNKSK